MKILLLTDDLLPGGVARHIIDLVHAPYGRDIKFCLAATPGEYLTKINSTVRFIPLNILQENSFEKNLFGFVPSYKRLSSIVQEEKFDIIHSHKRYSHLIGKLLAKQYGIPHITSYHSEHTGLKQLTFFGDYTICCSNAVRMMAIETYGCKKDKSKTIYYGIHPYKLHSEKEKRKTLESLGIKNKKRIISSVGQFIPEKDKPTLIRSVFELNKKMVISDVLFVLLGYGRQKQYLQTLIDDLHLGEYFLFVGGLFDVESLFNISEFMILNSKKEGFGIVMLEAASIAKMHIGTKVGGIPEFIEHNETGLLVPPEDSIALSTAIAYLLNNPLECVRMGENAKAKYLLSFTIDKMLDGIHEVYQNIAMK